MRAKDASLSLHCKFAAEISNGLKNAAQLPVPSKECVNFGIAVNRVDRTGVVTGGVLKDWLSVWTDCPKVSESGLVSVTPTFTRRFPVEKSGTVP